VPQGGVWAYRAAQGYTAAGTVYGVGHSSYVLVTDPQHFGFTDALGFVPLGGYLTGKGIAAGRAWWQARKVAQVDPTRRFPADPTEMTKLLGVEPVRVGTTPDGTPRIVWEPNSNTRIRFESHPGGLSPGDPRFNPRHHGPHYHVEIKPDGMTWSAAKRRGVIIKLEPPGYTPGSGTGFVPGELFPGW
ncbi:MAG: hypothetical protein QXP01_09470, partial [Candidatus Hadarchaeum sp.]